MRPANDSSVDYKLLVRSGYDLCAAAYHESVRHEAGRELDSLTERLEDGATVLDIGCGAGVPFARALGKRFAVTGVDISSEMLKRARANVPQATFIHGDIMAVEFSPSSFDAAVAFYSIFHLPREEHRKLFRRIYSWLKPGGHLLCSLTRSSEEPYTEDNFHGVTMYWSNYSLQEYEEILIRTGFNLLETSMIGHGYADGYDGPEERHPLVLAQKQSTRRDAL